MAEYAELRARHAADYQAAVPEHLSRLSWSRERVGAERERGLRALLRVAKERSPWHRARLAHVDVERITEADLTSIPPMSKDDMMANFDTVVTDPRLSRETVELHLDGLTTGEYLFDAYSVVASGGSSGTRGIFVYDWDGWRTCALSYFRFRTRALNRAGIAPDVVRVNVAGGKASHMSYSLPRAFLLGAGSETIAATLPLPDIVRRVNEMQPVIIGGYPTMIAALARESLAGRLRVAPRAVMCAAEPLLDEMQAVIGEAWGADTPVLNGYYTSEGASASGCGQGRGMHLNEDVCIFEPVDTEGKPVEPGERAAKLYVTQLFNHAQPLIRYELTDEVTLLSEDEGCACGSSMRRIDDIGGRSDDVFTYAGGVTVHPMTFRSPLGRQRHIVEYQVRQTANGADVALRTDGPVDLEALGAVLQTALAEAGVRDPRVNVNVVQAGFERQATGKFKRFFPLP